MTGGRTEIRTNGIPTGVGLNWGGEGCDRLSGGPIRRRQAAIGRWHKHCYCGASLEGGLRGRPLVLGIPRGREGLGKALGSGVSGASGGAGGRADFRVWPGRWRRGKMEKCNWRARFECSTTYIRYMDNRRLRATRCRGRGVQSGFAGRPGVGPTRRWTGGRWAGDPGVTSGIPGLGELAGLGGESHIFLYLYVDAERVFWDKGLTWRYLGPSRGL
jgi:hypothetical protein